jgi:uncharacterized protein YwgA
MNEHILLDLLAASEGKIIGRVRFQKVFYLLEKKGLGSGLVFSYHHYGPYCSELANALDLQVFFGNDILEEQIPRHDGLGSYSSIQLAAKREKPDSVGNLKFDDARKCISSINKYSSVVAELAATVHWLVHEERVSDWEKELKARKPGKSTEKNIQQAKQLLDEINLSI